MNCSCLEAGDQHSLSTPSGVSKINRDPSSPVAGDALV